MTEVIRLLRASYVPQFVLGGLTRIIGPVILRYATSTIPSAGTVLKRVETQTNFSKNAGTVSFTEPFEPLVPVATIPASIQHPASAISAPTADSLNQTGSSLTRHQKPLPTFLTLISTSVNLADCRLRDRILPVSLQALANSSSFAIVQAIRPVDLEYPPSAQTHALSVQTNAPSVPIHDPSAQIHVPSAQTHMPSAQALPLKTTLSIFSPLVICIFLALLATSAGVVLNKRIQSWWRVPKKNAAEAPVALIRIQELQKPSDCPNWRIPRDNAQIDPIQSPAASGTSKPVPPLAIVHDCLPPTTPPVLPPTIPLSNRPLYATYVPPHKRTKFNVAARRPLAEVTVVNSFGADHDSGDTPKLRRRLSTQLQSEHTFPKLRHQATFPVDTMKDPERWRRVENAAPTNLAGPSHSD
ncbi:hypothetical protein C8R43DRAFT_434564 [Mycena crocata]|nr:hypothetical protein C8R43DRAFT_434564 [Mycena crocata]